MSEGGGGGGLYEEIVDIYLGPLQIGLLVQNGNIGRGGGGHKISSVFFLGGGMPDIPIFGGKQ